MTILSHAVEILRQGVWASLTGGWCYDPRQTLACNVVHMYLWLFLFTLPLLITLCFTINWPVIAVYASIVAVLFSVLKIMNYYLHTIFDTHEPIDVVVATNADEEDEEETPARDLEEGVVAVDEQDHSEQDIRRRLDELDGAIGELENAIQGSTLYETLENSMAASSTGTVAFQDEEEVEYVTWESSRGVANTEPSIAVLDGPSTSKGPDEQYAYFNRPREGRHKKFGLKRKNKNIGKAESKDVAQQMSSSPDYLAVEADVHSMPNEPTTKDDILDIDNIELRMVRSDSKLASCSGIVETTVNVEIASIHKTTRSPDGRRILFRSDDTKINTTGDDGDEMYGENDDENMEENDAVASSSGSLAWFKRKYSEPVFIVAEEGESMESKDDVQMDETRRDSFDRFGRRRRSARKSIPIQSDMGNAVRRTRSTVETYAQHRGSGGRDTANGTGVGTASTSSTLLSETCLEKCRGKGVRKSYPGKTSSTDIFLLQHVGQRKQPSDGFRRMESNSLGSCGTGLEESGLMDGTNSGSQKVSDAGDKSGPNILSVNRVTRFHSVDVPLTDIPERESESERADGMLDMEIPTMAALRSGSVMESSLATTTTMNTSQSTDAYGTTRSDGHGINVSFYATASEDSPAPSLTREGSRRRWASSEDQSPQSPRRKLIQNLRDTLETLKSETSTTGSSTGTTVAQADRFVADLQALKDASTPDLRWLFDDAAAMLTATSTRQLTSSSSTGSSPVTRPRLASLHSQELSLPTALSKRGRDTAQPPSLPATLNRAHIPDAVEDTPAMQQAAFRELLMEEIKRLLEEIIDSHPEALEAIESVRQAKLARIARRAVESAGNTTAGETPKIGVVDPCMESYLGDDEDGYIEKNADTFDMDADLPGPSNRGHVRRRSSEDKQGIQTKKKGRTSKAEMTDEDVDEYETNERTEDLGENSTLAELARKRHIHVAATHDDTTDGAVHYFQDSDGKWYTYTFNEDNVATAQLLGSDRALMELIARQQEEAEARAARKQARGRAKTGGASSAGRSRDRRSDAGAGRSVSRRRHQAQSTTSRGGNRSQRQGSAVPLRIVLARTGSSSSEESFLALDAPASILHVGSGAGTSGSGAMTVSRLPALTSGDASSNARVALPLRLHRHSSGGQSSVLATSSSATARRRASGTRTLMPLRHMLGRTSGSGSVQFPSSGGSLSFMPPLDSLARAQNAASLLSHHNNDVLATPGEYSNTSLPSSYFDHTTSDLSHSSFRARFLATLAGGVEGLPSGFGQTSTMAVLGGAGQSNSAATMKRKQYYRVSLCPRLNVCCCPNWLSSRLAAWKFWSPNTGSDTGEVRSGWRLCPKRTFKLRLDRLRLMAMFDRNRTKFSAFIDVLLAVLVTLVACGILSRPLYYDFQFVLACVLTAGAQFSLMKSVQPDAASPVHGYNALAAYSRPVYYCLFGILVYSFDRFYSYHPSNPYATETLYSTWSENWEFWWNNLKDFWATLFLFLPLIFTFGLLPQLNTFAIYVLEQVDMLIFGGTASVGLASGIFSVGRSILFTTILFILSYVSMERESTRPTQNVIFSAFCGCAVAVSYLLSRSSSDPRLFGAVFSRCEKPASKCLSPSNDAEKRTSDTNLFDEAHKLKKPGSRRKRQKSITTEDPLPAQLRETMILRLKHDFMCAFVLGVLYFGLHCSTAFTVFKSTLVYVLPPTAVAVGFVCHYLLPQLRSHTPWKIFSAPVLKTWEHRIFDVDCMARMMPFERLYAVLNFSEKNLLYPLVVIYMLTTSGEELLKRFGIYWTSLFLSVTSMKLLRASFCNAGQLYLPLGVAVLFKFVDYPWLSVTLLVDFYVFTILYPKLMELILKLQFIFSYVAPWQISWGSAFHAFAQPTAIPHSAFTLAITTVSSFLSAPLNPFLGSAVFLMSYMRPVKFWEKNYNTKRVDHSNTRLISQIDRGPMTDDSNLNAIFYEHLTRSLQRSLAGDLQLGRLATTVNAGDCFILASYYLNCLVHVVEVGNGFVTFQLRGLEFRGTYCQQREVEAISEEIADQGCCCCCSDGSSNSCCCLKGFLSLNAIWNLSWLSWRVTAAKFVLEGYSVSDNSALSLLQLIELRKLLVTLYIKCILFYTLKSGKLDEWMCTEAVVSALDPISKDAKYVDVDPSFCSANDDDYDCRLNGISKQSFCQHFLHWIEYCCARRKQANGLSCEKDSLLTALCYALTLVGRRVLGAAAQGRHTSGAESFLYGLHALFKGDFRITCTRDEWVFADMDILKSVIAPAVRMALKLHQDHFTAPDDFESMDFLYDTIDHYDQTIFISHENDPSWRHAVLTNTRSLLALRHVFEDGQDDFKIIMLNRRHMNFRVIELNKECVRAFWAGQQQELIFLRNRNPERGSIQNARQVLRNMINSSADQPIGYPIYVSPLTTSFVETHEQISKCLGPPLSLNLLGNWCSRLWRCLLGRCGTSGSSNIIPSSTPSGQPPAAGLVHFRSSRTSGSAGIAETSFEIRRQGQIYMGSSASRSSSGTRPRLSLLTAAPNRRDGDSGRASFGGARTTGIITRPPLLPPRHGSAPPVMQRSLTHPIRSTSLTTPQDRQPRSRSPFHTPSRSRESLTLRQLVTSVVGPAAAQLVNSVVATGGTSNATPMPRVSLGSLMALNVEDEIADHGEINVEGEISVDGPSVLARRGKRVRIVDVSMVLENLDKDLPRVAGRTPVVWPSEEWRRRGGRQSWKSWRPEKSLEGSVVHKWMPWNADPKRRSHLDKTILLVHVLDGKYFVPILEQGVEWIGDEL